MKTEIPMGVDLRYEPFKTKILIGTNSANIRSIDDQEAYDLSQMLGELGGAWGLFLGASFVNVSPYSTLESTGRSYTIIAGDA